MEVFRMLGMVRCVERAMAVCTYNVCNISVIYQRRLKCDREISSHHNGASFAHCIVLNVDLFLSRSGR